MNLPDLHETYMSDSSRIHPGFMTLSFKPTRSNLCQIHGTFMVVAWQFHGTFTSKPDLGTGCQSPLKPNRFWLSIVFFCDFNFIFCNMSDSCRFHGTFCMLILFFLKNQNQQLDSSQKWRSSLNVRFIANSSRIQALPCHFHVIFNQTEPQTVSLQFHGIFSQAYY